MTYYYYYYVVVVIGHRLDVGKRNIRAVHLAAGDGELGRAPFVEAADALNRRTTPQCA